MELQQLPAAATCCAFAVNAAADAQRKIETDAVLEPGFPTLTFNKHEEDQFPAITTYVQTRLIDLRRMRINTTIMADDMRESDHLLNEYKCGTKLPLDLVKQTTLYNDRFAERVSFEPLGEATETLKSDVDNFCNTTLGTLNKNLTHAEATEGEVKTDRRTKVRRNAFNIFIVTIGHLQKQVNACVKLVRKRLNDERKASVNMKWRIGYKGNAIGSVNNARLATTSYDVPTAIVIPTRDDSDVESEVDGSSSSDEEVGGDALVTKQKDLKEATAKTSAAAASDSGSDSGGDTFSSPVTTSGSSSSASDGNGKAKPSNVNGSKRQSPRNLAREITSPELAEQKIQRAKKASKQQTYKAALNVRKAKTAISEKKRT